jgi:hypothetical protein
MGLVTAAAEVLEFLIEHADLVDDVVDLIRSGASKDSIRKALRDIKVSLSDKLIQDELGLGPDWKKKP